MKANLIMESFFSGSAEEWLNQIPESLIDKAIEILSIDPNVEMKPTGYSPIDNSLFQHTAKICLWKDLVQVIHRWGMPAPSIMQTSPALLKTHAENLKDKLSGAIKALESLEYVALFEAGTLSKEFKVGYGLRQVSELIRINTEGGRSPFISPLDIRLQYEGDGVWGKHYPIDNDIENAAKILKKIVRSVDKLLDDPIYRPARRGEKKKGKDAHDALVWGLCYIYKKYTDKPPISWNTGTSATNAGKFTGKIIPFLQTILPYTSYSGKITPGALQKKIIRIRDRKKHKDIWQDSKN